MLCLKRNRVFRSVGIIFLLLVFFRFSFSSIFFSLPNYIFIQLYSFDHIWFTFNLTLELIVKPKLKHKSQLIVDYIVLFSWPSRNLFFSSVWNLTQNGEAEEREKIFVHCWFACIKKLNEWKKKHWTKMKRKWGREEKKIWYDNERNSPLYWNSLCTNQILQCTICSL